MDERLKRRLLGEAVDDNLRAIRNQPRPRWNRQKRFSWSFAVAGLAIVVALAALSVALRERAPRAEANAAPATPADEPRMRQAPARVSGSVFPVAVRRVAIDPGHGGGDLGTHTPTGLVEKDLTLDLAHRARRAAARARLSAHAHARPPTSGSTSPTAPGSPTRRAPTSSSRSISTGSRTAAATAASRPTTSVPPTIPTSPSSRALENRESGYAMADVRRLLDSIYADLRQEQSRALAAAVQERAA